MKIITLAIAFGSSALILSFSLSEFGYDRFHQDYKSIFRILQRNNAEIYDGNRLSNKIPANITASLISMANDSLVLSRVKLMKDLHVEVGGQTFHNCSFYAADRAIANILTFDILYGSLDGFRHFEKKVILSSAMAKKYFGTSRAVGNKLKIFTLKDTLTFTVAAVFKDYPHNSHEAFDSFIPFNEAAFVRFILIQRLSRSLERYEE